MTVIVVVLASVIWMFFILGKYSEFEKYPTAIDTNDPAIHRAIEDARQTRSKFYSKYWRYRDTARYQISLETGDTKEFVWLELNEMLADELTGMILSVPVNKSKYKKGDIITVKEETITDWVWYESDGARVGGYTIDLLQ